MIYIKSQGGKQKLLTDDGQIYNQEKVIKGKKRWRCHNRSCKGSLVISETNVIIRYSHHNHEPEPVKSKKANVLDDLRTKSIDSHRPISQILSEEVRNLEENIILQIPSRASLRDQMCKIRGNTMNKVDIGISDIPDIFKFDSNGNIF